MLLMVSGFLVEIRETSTQNRQYHIMSIVEYIPLYITKI